METMISGVLTLIGGDAAHTDVNLVLSCDMSGSMGEVGSDGKTAWDHVVQTVERLLNFLRTLEGRRVGVVLRKFNQAVSMVWEADNACASSLEEVGAAVERLRGSGPEGMTNFSDVFATLRSHVDPGALNVHVFMTDGEPTFGRTTAEEIVAPVQNSAWSHQIIGQTRDHAYEILRTIRRNTDGHQQFIDSIEHCGMVYGEILADILQRAERRITVRPVDPRVQVYDADGGAWVEEVRVPQVLAEDRRDIHVRVNGEADTELGEVDKKVLVDVSGERTLMEPEVVSRDSLQKYEWRQRVLEGMHNRETDYAELLGQLQAFMHGVPEEDVDFQRQLADDCYVQTRRDLPELQRAIRLTSQAQQRAQNVSNIPAPRAARRCYTPDLSAGVYGEEEEEEEEDGPGAGALYDGDDSDSDGDDPAAPLPTQQQMRTDTFSSQRSPARRRTMDALSQ